MLAPRPRLTLRGEGKDSPDPTPDPRPAKPVHPEMGTGTEMPKAVEQLIDQLAEVSEQRLVLPRLAVGGVLTSRRDKSPSRFYEPSGKSLSPDAIRRIGLLTAADAAAALIAHLYGDQTQDKNQVFGWAALHGS